MLGAELLSELLLGHDLAHVFQLGAEWVHSAQSAHLENDVVDTLLMGRDYRHVYGITIFLLRALA